MQPAPGISTIDSGDLVFLPPDVVEQITLLREEQLGLMKLYPSARFVPCGKIADWIDAVGSHDMNSGRVVTYLLSGANGVGKTRGLSEQGSALLRGPQGEWLDRPLFREFPRPCRIRLISTQAALEEGALREMSELLRPDLAEGYPKKGGTTWFSEWVMKDGSRMDVYSWQQGITTHAGASIDALLLDEPGPRAVYDEATARLRAGGPVIWGMTPVDGRGGTSADVAWVFDEIVRAESGEGDGAWRVFYADAEDSCIEHGVRGRVPHKVIADRMRRWQHDPLVLKARFYGRHALELGRVLRFWNPKTLICKDEDYVLQPMWPRYGAMDTHPSRAQVYTFCVLTPFYELLVWREVVDNGTIAEVAEKVKSLHRQFGEPELLVIDPLACTPNPITGTSILDEYRRHGLHFRSAGGEKSDKMLGIDKIHEMMRGVNKRPLIRVNENCRLTIQQATRWCIDPKTLAPGKENDDTWENLYRIALNVPRMPTDYDKAIVQKSRQWRSPLIPPKRVFGRG